MTVVTITRTVIILVIVSYHAGSMRLTENLLTAIPYHFLLGAKCWLCLQALVQQLLHFSLHSYRGVRSSAILALESCMKQFPAYIMQLLPVPLAALAKLPIPQADLATQNADLPSAVLDSLRSAMREAAASSTISADPKAEDASVAGGSGRGLLPL